MKRKIILGLAIFVLLLRVVSIHHQEGGDEPLNSTEIPYPKISEKEAKKAKELITKIDIVTINPPERDSVVIDKKIGIINKVVYKPAYTLWKGHVDGIVKLDDGKELKARISCYGNFFSIVGIPGYYVFEGEYADKWRTLTRY